MRYLNEQDLRDIGLNWKEMIGVIERSVGSLAQNDYAQPIKPYLRYNDQKNRIIAMPAFLGGDTYQAGIKWIASFPENIEKHIPRAHSVVILNDADTGEPKSIVNTPLLSMLRTASVSGAIIRAYNQVRELRKLKVGIIGWGPIGQQHFHMIQALLGDQVDEFVLYDIRPINREEFNFLQGEKVQIGSSWEDAYHDADIFITCTVAKEPYIDQPPKKGSLHLNVSLRDYKVEIAEYMQGGIIVDNWEEVCRESTDIENMHITKGLTKEDTLSIVDVICDGRLKNITKDQVLMFNPMGMAIFDIAMGSYYYRKAEALEIGTKL
ncbi:2,3-diaminopropionate biosynthesis protein SbnB [Hazenella sp. IB182357]|uniref:2,3-diaminopropionate biosynthesis protein SbnB n=1 Tax=Polycladospora coralii TaxID=2771432 RepID=A0A926NA71_9BACL|nr:2,3-diaminopropionate biosynthesis protein SbnB [Polycladospora coralii]MBD1372683.1 2,3-diaminopropionate biosynthesis protein SbnB [Polycladospora coralii]MBS7531077.1 2,3-diaminopropionate biosynthesis protein SbnB [Polycladospora coralii]